VQGVAGARASAPLRGPPRAHRGRSAGPAAGAARPRRRRARGAQVVRGTPAAPLAQLLRGAGPALRAAAGLGAWELLARPPGGAPAVGRVLVSPGLAAAPAGGFREPTILVLERVGGDEDVPQARARPGLTRQVRSPNPDRALGPGRGRHRGPVAPLPRRAGRRRQRRRGRAIRAARGSGQWRAARDTAKPTPRRSRSGADLGMPCADRRRRRRADRRRARAQGCVAVVAAQAPDVLSHAAVRARNAGALMAACLAPAVRARLAALAGSVARLVPSQARPDMCGMLALRRRLMCPCRLLGARRSLRGSRVTAQARAMYVALPQIWVASLALSALESAPLSGPIWPGAAERRCMRPFQARRRTARRAGSAVRAAAPRQSRGSRRRAPRHPGSTTCSR